MRAKLLVAALAAGMIGHAPAQTAPAAQPAPAAPDAAAAAPAETAAPTAAQPAAPASAQRQKYLVPAGTRVLLSLKSAVNTRTARPGDGVYLVSTFPVVIDGHVLIPDGVYVQGVVDRVERPGRIKGRAKITFHFNTLIFPNGQVVSIPGVVNSLPGSTGPNVKGDEGTVEQASQKGRDAGTVVKGAGAGAGLGAIGGIAGGSPVQGIAYGGAAGAAAGALYTMFTRGDDINIPPGSPIEMVLQRPLSLEAQQFAAVDIQPAQLQQNYNPADQQKPMKKPQRVCAQGQTTCN